MEFFRRYLQSLFFSKRFYWGLAAIIVLFVFAYFSQLLFIIARIVTLFFFLLIIIDYIVLYKITGITAKRILPERLSNGDENKIKVIVTNDYSFRAAIRLIDELPVQFQKRDFYLKEFIASGEERSIIYNVKPLERGEYIFFDLNVFATTPLNLVVRRYKIPAQQMVKVYPSYFSLRKYDLLAYSNNLSESGNRKIRKIGQSVEFEQIREYVSGDDIRTINWKATARKGGQHMVNNYMDERSQQVYCIIAKGRVMKMPL